MVHAPYNTFFNAETKKLHGAFRFSRYYAMILVRVLDHDLVFVSKVLVLVLVLDVSLTLDAN